MRRLLESLSVGSKLSLGFGLVLLSTVGVALTALNSNGVLEEHSDQLRSEASIQALILQARIAEKDFALNLTPKSAEQVQLSIEQLVQKIDTNSNAALAWVTVRKASSDYLQQFLHYADSTRQVRAARLRMQDLASVAGESFIAVFLDRLDALDVKLQQSAVADSEMLNLVEQAAGLRDKLVKVRNSELSYSLEAEERYRDDWESNLSSLLSAMQMLALRLSQEEQKSLKDAEAALADYRGAFELFVDGRRKAARASSLMSEEAHRVDALLNDANLKQELAIRTDSKAANQQLWIIFMLALALGIGASFLLRQLILHPLRQAVSLAQRVASGDLSNEPMTTGRRDELGQLVETVYQMLSNLRGLVGRIGDGVGRLQFASGDLVNVIKRTSIGVEQQRHETELTVAAMQQMTTTAIAVTESASEASEAVRLADEQAREGDELVRHANAKIGRLADEMSLAAGAMQSLLTESSTIGGVLDVIKAIADQTNLLALNAAVEAARAGDHGRGFAVVADEVRGLAKRTQVSTREIENLIDSFRNVTQQAAERLAGSHVLSDEAAVLAGQACESLSRITHAVSSIEQMNRKITAAAQEQRSVAEQVGQCMARVKCVAESGAKENTSLQLATNELQHIGCELDAAVGHFST